MVDKQVDDTQLFQFRSFYDETLFLKNIFWTLVVWTVVIWTEVVLDTWLLLAPHRFEIVWQNFPTVPDTQRSQVLTTLVYAAQGVSLQHNNT